SGEGVVPSSATTSRSPAIDLPHVQPALGTSRARTPRASGSARPPGRGLAPPARDLLAVPPGVPARIPRAPEARAGLSRAPAARRGLRPDDPGLGARTARGRAAPPARRAPAQAEPRARRVCGRTRRAGAVLRARQRGLPRRVRQPAEPALPRVPAQE